VKRAAETISSHPWLVLAGALGLTMLAGVGIARLGFDNSSERLLVQDSPDATFLEGVRRAFGGDEILFVLLRAADVTRPGPMQDLARITDAVRRVAGVERVASLATLKWAWPSGDDVAVERVFTADGTPAAGAPIATALAHPLVEGTLVTHDRHLAAVLAFVRPRPEDPRFKGQLVAAVHAAVADVAPQADVFLGGAPYGQVEIDRLTRHDLRVLGLAALVAMAILLGLTYRGAVGVVLPLVTVVLSLVWTLGVAGMCGISISVVTSILIPLVLAIATSYCIRILSEHARQYTLGRSGPDAVAEALREVGTTVMLCGATTALGFLPLRTSHVDVLRDLGTLAVVASMLSTLAALTVVPAVLALGGRRTPSERSFTRLRPLLVRIDELTSRRPWTLLGIGAAAVALATVGLQRLQVDQSPWDWFPEGSAVHLSTHVIDQELGGVLPFSIVLQSPNGPWDPALLRATDALTTALRADASVRAAAGPADLLRIIAVAFDGPSAPLPERQNLIAQYALLYDPETLSPYLDEPGGRQHLLVRIAHASTREVQAFVNRVDARIAALVPPPVTARLTGTGLLRVATAYEFAAGLFRHLFLASLAIAVLLTVALRSPALGAIALVPNLLPILLVYGLLGWFGIPLNVATVTTGAAALGNAVDDTVQYLARYRRLRLALGAGARLATLEAVGSPMIVSDVVLTAGFAALMAASFFPVASLGLLGATAMAFSLVGNLLLLPALVVVWERWRGAGSSPVT